MRIGLTECVPPLGDPGCKELPLTFSESFWGGSRPIMQAHHLLGPEENVPGGENMDCALHRCHYS